MKRGGYNINMKKNKRDKLKELTEIKREIWIYLRMKGLRNSDIARVLNISRERVAQIAKINLTRKNTCDKILSEDKNKEF